MSPVQAISRKMNTQILRVASQIWRWKWPVEIGRLTFYRGSLLDGGCEDELHPHLSGLKYSGVAQN